MKYKFLYEWAKENEIQNLYFSKIKKFTDQYVIYFQKTDKFLQINFASEDCFCFFSRRNTLPFAENKSFSQFNRTLATAKLENISISENDRIIFLSFSKTDIYNQKIHLQIILELIPHYQNIILVKNDLGKKRIIIDALKKISFAENKHRQILPGLEYVPPVSEYQNDKEKIFYPLHLSENGKITENAITNPIFNSVNELFESLYYDYILRFRQDKIREKKIREIDKKIKKKINKLEKLRNELRDAEAVEKWKRFAELLKGNFDKIKPGMESIKVTNYYEDGFPVLEIPLFPDKSARQNVDYYFKKYKKAKTGKKIIFEQIRKTEAEILALKRKTEQIKNADNFFASEEITSKSKTKTANEEHFKFLQIDENWRIYLGRTAKENDILTTKMAKPQDWWFHSRIFHGAHLILRNYNRLQLPEKLKILCCRLAAYHSKAGKSSNVPVDYTQIRYVRKPKGSPAGYVTYTNQKTMYVDPLSWREAAQWIKKEWMQK